MARVASNFIRNKIKEFEVGSKLKPKLILHPDTTQGYSIGYGHFTRGSKDKSPNSISAEKAEQLFDEDIKEVERLINSNLKVKINQNQFDALVSFAYNNQKWVYHIIQLLNANRPLNEIGAIFKKIVHADNKRIDGLVARRYFEWQLFNKSDYSNVIKIGIFVLIVSVVGYYAYKNREKIKNLKIVI